MVNHVVLIFCGKAHSGKNTAADYVSQQLNRVGYEVIKVGLADQLKHISQRLIKLFYGIHIPIEDFYDESAKERVRDDLPQFDGHPFKLRTVLQKIGTDIFRDMLWENIWCDTFYRQHWINPFNDRKVAIIINDTRFPNELKYFKRLVKNDQLDKCLSFKLNRGRVLSAHYTAQTKIESYNQNHQSEALIDQLKTDFQLDNNSTYERLYQQLDQILHSEGVI